MELVELPSCSPEGTVVFVGRNRRGNWVAREQSGIFGGLFVSRAQALRYALLENGHCSQTIFEVSREIELDIPANTQLACPNARRDPSAQFLQWSGRAFAQSQGSVIITAARR
ncbi:MULTISPECIES: hypothetical protein [Bradyrhizobium]|uniref:hypothetical protein n=1 Tax=Bradyrhizobium centrosematis TaxID=1300039 RepID=UPI00286DA5F9|nr:hypothetical protein [Bradyrhizobium centrosematis]MCS3765673.1 hypothetical protein [Bradyrhizobium centrosematis]MCS3777899.1 hypothetical protein [Bradyrhizobium centrosematis]